MASVSTNLSAVDNLGFWSWDTDFTESTAGEMPELGEGEVFFRVSLSNLGFWCVLYLDFWTQVTCNRGLPSRISGQGQSTVKA